MASYPAMRRLRSTLPLLLDLLLVVALSTLDVRDLYYKIAYLGPFNSFAFYAVSQRTLKTAPLVPTMNLTALEQHAIATNHQVTSAMAVVAHGSGWPSLLSSCASIQPASAFFFIGAMGQNCTVGAGTHTQLIPKLYLSGTLRADSMAWAACKLLYRHRRPQVCGDPLVLGFTDRYGLEDPAVTPEMMAISESPAEQELLQLLDVLAKSEPLYRVTCVDSFIYNGSGAYTTHLFGCGAPNVHQSAFVGLHATAFKQLHRDKAWLTVDTINLMGVKYILRQNVKSEFTAVTTATSANTQLTHKTVTNYSSSGTLYNLMICVDVLLMVLNLWSSIEIARLMLVPLTLAAFRGSGDSSVVDNYQSILTCPLYRSRPIVWLTVATQLISWVIILPNSTIFTWSVSARMAKIQAYLSSLRLWVLILLFVNELWDWLVFCNEKLAYAISKRTFIQCHEIIAVAALVSYYKRTQLFAVTGVKYAEERQRNTDKTSFNGTTAFGNSYNPANDGLLVTQASALWALYCPLVVILLWSVLGVCGVLVARWGVLAAWHKCQLWRKKRRGTTPVTNKRTQEEKKKERSSSTSKVQATENEEKEEEEEQDEREEEEDDGQLFTTRSHAEETRMASRASVVPMEDRLSEDEQEDQEEDHDEDDEYERLPLEELLNDPIRARSIVRASLEMETATTTIDPATGTRTTERFIRMPVLLEYGVVVDRGQLRVRHGFFISLQSDVGIEPYVPRAIADAMASIHGRRLTARPKAQ